MTERGDIAPLLETMAGEVRAVHASDPGRERASIEAYLERRLGGRPAAERVALLAELVRRFEAPRAAAPAEPVPDREAYTRLFSLLLGKSFSADDLTPAELTRKLAQSFNTIFDTLNQIINVINSTLLGRKSELETIRHIIGSNLEGVGTADSLQGYLDQIQRAFLVAHKAFQQAARTKLTEVLAELDPEKIARDAEGGLKFGALRKAELFDIYKEKHQACRSFLESGRLNEDFLREFEKICQRLYKTETREGRG